MKESGISEDSIQIQYGKHPPLMYLKQELPGKASGRQSDGDENPLSLNIIPRSYEGSQLLYLLIYFFNFPNQSVNS